MCWGSHSCCEFLVLKYLLLSFFLNICASGGTILRISGRRGFSRDELCFGCWWAVGHCDIVNSTETSVWCETPPPSLAGAQSLWRSGLAASPSPPAFAAWWGGLPPSCEVAATPVVTVMRGEVANQSLRLYVEGQNLSDSVVLLGNLSCDLQTPSPGSNLSLAGCTFSLDTLEAGLYPLQIHQRQMGFADMSAVPGSGW